MIYDPSAGDTWISVLQYLLKMESTVSPRGMRTKEAIGWQTTIDMNYPIIDCPDRDLGYKFMAAEAYWILSGDNRVESIEPYSKKIADYSDDGFRFFGAYGPKVVDQLSYVVRTLINDPDSRQAVMNIWREQPGKTKDVPCTLSLQFFVRQDKLTICATMRSSDAWMGLPYDIVNFSCIGHLVCLMHNQIAKDMFANISPGILCVTAGSQHLYDHNWDEAQELGIDCIQGSPSIPFNKFETQKDLMNLLARGKAIGLLEACDEANR